MDFRAILYEIKNQIARITLNRPDALNAINQEMSREIVEACSAAENDARAFVEKREPVWKGR
jgi:enoyl-CoA hydratase/carnithine racemase